MTPALSDRLLRMVQSNWADWYNETAPGRLDYAAIAGGPAHRARAMMFVFPDGGRLPAVVIKLGYSQRENQFLQAEFDTLDELYPDLPERLRTTVPAPLGVGSIQESFYFAMTAVKGKRLHVPQLHKDPGRIDKSILRSYVRRTVSWCQSLAAIKPLPSIRDVDVGIVDEFARKYAETGIEDEHLAEFARSSDLMRVLQSPTAWQHGAIDPTNALSHKGRIAFVDWEHAGPYYEWFDVAYLPISVIHLVARQRPGIPPREAISTVLSTRGGVGWVLRSEIEGRWTGPSLLSAVTVAAMRTALRRDRGSRRPLAAKLAFELLDPSLYSDGLQWLVTTR